MILNHEDALTESGYEGMNLHWTRMALVNAFEAARADAYADGRKDEAEERGWRPIDTAPKDGTWFLTWRDRHTFHEVQTAQWREDPFHPGGMVLGGPSWSFAEFSGFPTHWAPHPTPPAA